MKVSRSSHCSFGSGINPGSPNKDNETMLIYIGKESYLLFLGKKLLTMIRAKLPI